MPNVITQTRSPIPGAHLFVLNYFVEANRALNTLRFPDRSLGTFRFRTLLFFFRPVFFFIMSLLIVIGNVLHPSILLFSA